MKTYLEIFQLLKDEFVDLGFIPTESQISEVLIANNLMLNHKELNRLSNELQVELSGFGLLSPVITNVTTDVLVNSHDAVWVDEGLGLKLHKNIFTDAQSVSFLARRLASLANSRLDEAKPYVDGLLPNGVRLHALLPPVSGSCAKISLRFPSQQIIPISEWQKNLQPSEKALLEQVCEGELSFVISGETGSGKTTLLKSILVARPKQHRIVLIEEAAEIQLHLENIVSLVARSSNTEGFGEMTMQNLVRQSLRMRPDSIVIGEVRGLEVLDFLLAISSGHIGSGTTIHSTAFGVTKRIQLLAQIAKLSSNFAQELFEEAIDVVIHCEKSVSGRRISALIANKKP